MRAAIAAAAVGDEQKREDPTVNELESARRCAPRPGGGRLPADGDDGEPDRAAPPHRAGRRAARRGELPRLHLRARRARRPLGRRHAGPAGRRRPLHAASRFAPPLAFPRSTRHGRGSSGSRTRTTPPAGASGRSRRSTSCARSATSSTSASISTARGCSTRPSRAGRRRRRSAGASTRSRSASRRVSAARSARSSPDPRRRWRAPAASSTSSAARCGRRGSSRPRASTRSTTTSSGSPTTTRARSGSPSASPRRGSAVDPDRVETNFVQVDVAPLDARRGDGAARRARRRPLRDDPSHAAPRGHPPRRRRRRHRPRARADPARAGRSCQRLRRSARSSSARLRRPSPSSARRRSAPSVFRGDELLWQRRGRPRGRRGRNGRLARDPVPDRLDHEDLHGRLRPPAPRRRRALARRPARPVHSRRARTRRRSGGCSRTRPASSASRPARSGRRCRRRAREELVERTADAEQPLAPGSWWHYSNLAFALLGEVVARQTGGTWEDALRRAGARAARAPADDGRRARSPRRAATSSSRTRTSRSSSPIRTSAAPVRSASSGRRPAISRAGARSSPPATSGCSLRPRSRRCRTSA